MTRRIGRAVTGLLLIAILALLGALVVVPRLMGWAPLTILTGSMEPTIPTGSQVIVEPVVGEEEARELQVGDVITVMPYPEDPTLVTHRVVERHDSASGVSFVTQGDANGTADAWDVTATQIRGEVRYHVPLAGYVATLLDGGQKATGAVIAAAALLVYAGVQVVGAVRGRRADESEVEQADADATAPDGAVTDDDALTAGEAAVLSTVGSGGRTAGGARDEPDAAAPAAVGARRRDLR